jgi:hypothetical protein
VAVVVEKEKNNVIKHKIGEGPHGVVQLRWVLVVTDVGVMRPSDEKKK